MMHVRYKLRESEKFVVPKGPSFSRGRNICIDIDGTLIRFKTPKHYPYNKNIGQTLPEKEYQLARMPFISHYDETSKLKDNWKKLSVFKNDWAFNGSWLTGSLAHLSMNFSFVKVVNYENDFSLFHPRAFEKIIGDYLTYQYSRFTSDSHDGKHHYIAPVNWNPLSCWQVIAARMDVKLDQDVMPVGSDVHIMFFPISNDVIASVQFRPSRILNITQKELDKRVSKQPMLDLIDEIINSFQLTLSSEALNAQKIALAGLDDASLINDYPPLQWPVGVSNKSTEHLE